MRPSDLFGKPLTYPRHEKGDIHYIGEALPAPSQAVSVLSSGTPAYVGGSSVPAREDHVHALDLEDLIAALVALGDIEVDLSNYYTIAEVDALLATINADIITLFDVATDHETRISALEAGGGGGGVGIGDFAWSYVDQICAPTTTIYSDIWIPPTSIEIIEVVATARITGTEDYTVGLYINASLADSFSWTQPNTFGTSGALSFAVDDTDLVQIAISPDGGTGDAEDVMIIVRYGPP